MNAKNLILFLFLTATISCNQSSQKEENSLSENTVVKQEQPADTSGASQNQGVYFVNLKNGDKVKSPVIVQMGVRGMEVEPAGALDEGKGHHHLIIDDSFVEKGEAVPKDETHIHFGKGQTVDTLQLSPGQHTLTLQFANGMHQSYGKDWSKTISITVEH